MNIQPEVVAWLHTIKIPPYRRGVSLHYEEYDTSIYGDSEPLVRLSDYENLLSAAKELADWCLNDVGADPTLTPGLERVMEITGVDHDAEA